MPEGQQPVPICRGAEISSTPRPAFGTGFQPLALIRYGIPAALPQAGMVRAFWPFALPRLRFALVLVA
jgi:hypothetical protein